MVLVILPVMSPGSISNSSNPNSPETWEILESTAWLVGGGKIHVVLLVKSLTPAEIQHHDQLSRLSTLRIARF